MDCSWAKQMPLWRDKKTLSLNSCRICQLFSNCTLLRSPGKFAPVDNLKSQFLKMVEVDYIKKLQVQPSKRHVVLCELSEPVFPDENNRY